MKVIQLLKAAIAPHFSPRKSPTTTTSFFLNFQDGTDLLVILYWESFFSNIFRLIDIQVDNQGIIAKVLNSSKFSLISMP